MVLMFNYGIKTTLEHNIGQGQYSIKYVQKWDDHYVLDAQGSSLIWYSKDYNDTKMTTREYSFDKLTKSLEVVE